MSKDKLRKTMYVGLKKTDMGLNTLKNRANFALRMLTDRRARVFFTQRRIEGIEARRRQAALIAAKCPPATDATGHSTKIAHTLSSEGYAMVDAQIPPQWIVDLRDYFTNRPVGDHERPDVPKYNPPGGRPHGTSVGFYTAEEVIVAPHVMEIANNPEIIAAVSEEMGAKPIIGYIAVWWAFNPGEGVRQFAEDFHRDVDDYDWTKLFVYLNDVDERNGPHSFMPRSHLSDEMKVARRYSDDEVYDIFGKENEKIFTGKAGTAFLEKTYGLHKGKPVSEGARLLLQVVYTLTPLMYGPMRPVADLPDGYDRYINQVYCRS